MADWERKMRCHADDSYLTVLEKRSEAMEGTIVNVQLGRFTTHANAMLLLPDT